MLTVDWLIVGGGPHGAHVAIRLVDKGVRSDKMAILDPHPEPLAQWKHHTMNAGMTHLRSPEFHNIGVDPYSLGRHAATHGFVAATHEEEFATGSHLEHEFIPPYSRPSLRLFNHHSESEIVEAGLTQRWKTGKAVSITRVQGAYLVRTECGEPINAKNVVLALGMGGQLCRPNWAMPANGKTQIRHVFDPNFRRESIAKDSDVVIAGAGITAAQLALSLVETDPNRRVTIISRHFLRKEDFDSDPGWLGPKLLNGFHAEADYAKRRTMIREARNRGSLASEVMQRLQAAILHDKTIKFEMANIESVSGGLSGSKWRLHMRPFELDECEYHRTGNIAFTFSDALQNLEVDVVVLATGFESKRPGGAFIDRAIGSMGLPIAEDGFPVVDYHLRWRRGLFVMGALAELEIGPASRNISGARMAADRIIDSAEVKESVNPLGDDRRYRLDRLNRHNSLLNQFFS